MEKREDLIRIEDPMYGEYVEMRHSGASHESAVQAIKCELAIQGEIAMRQRTADLLKRMTFT